MNIEKIMKARALIPITYRLRSNEAQTIIEVAGSSSLSDIVSIVYAYGFMRGQNYEKNKRRNA